MNEYEYELELNNITKHFGNIVANHDITIKVKKGTIHALVGENGSGKSTLMSILFGLYEQDSGSIIIQGHPVVIKSPAQATDIGIGMVHQHFKLVDVYTNLENIVLGNEFTRKASFLDLKKARTKVEILQKIFNLNFDLDERSGIATVATRQKVEIVKMLYRDADVLIFDEPTAVLTPQEIDDFLEIVRFLKAKGKTIIFISHKLWEVKAISDEVTVLRLGEVVKHYPTLDGVELQEVANAMVGHNVAETKNLDHNFQSEIAFKLENVSYGKLQNVSLEIHKGEIYALAGIDGNGQQELEEIITGIKKPTSGNIYLNNSDLGLIDITKFSVKKKNTHGISIIPEDRHKHGLVLDYSINDNAIIRRLEDQQFVNKINNFIKIKAKEDFSHEIIEKFDVRGANNGYAIARSLSGGNQQKAIVGREMLTDHDFILIMQPTRGLDVGAINFIHQQIINEKAKGKGVLLISYELDEVISLADTIGVINKGRILGEGPADSFTREEIGLLMAGITGEEDQEMVDPEVPVDNLDAQEMENVGGQYE